MELIDSTVAAQIIGVHRSTVNRWADSGRLPFVMKTHGRTGMRLFDRATVEWLAREFSEPGTRRTPVRGGTREARVSDPAPGRMVSAGGHSPESGASSPRRVKGQDVGASIADVLPRELEAS